MGKDGDSFPNPEECIMIFGGSDAIYSKRQHKVRFQEACVAEMVVPSFFCWLESLITFDQRDHPSHVTRPGRYPLIVDPIVRKKRLTKVLMDRGSGLNILYVDTLDTMHIPWSELRPASSPFHDVIPGAQAYPLGQIDLPVTFGDRANFSRSCSPLRWWTSRGLATPSWSGHATPSSWRSPTTPT